MGGREAWSWPLVISPGRPPLRLLPTRSGDGLRLPPTLCALPALRPATRPARPCSLRAGRCPRARPTRWMLWRGCRGRSSPTRSSCRWCGPWSSELARPTCMPVRRAPAWQQPLSTGCTLLCAQACAHLPNKQRFIPAACVQLVNWGLVRHLASSEHQAKLSLARSLFVDRELRCLRTPPLQLLLPPPAPPARAGTRRGARASALGCMPRCSSAPYSSRGSETAQASSCPHCAGLGRRPRAGRWGWVPGSGAVEGSQLSWRSECAASERLSLQGVPPELRMAVCNGTAAPGAPRPAAAAEH